jgi:hypothetical protein
MATLPFLETVLSRLRPRREREPMATLEAETELD